MKRICIKTIYLETEYLVNIEKCKVFKEVHKGMQPIETDRYNNLVNSISDYHTYHFTVYDDLKDYLSEKWEISKEEYDRVKEILKRHKDLKEIEIMRLKEREPPLNAIEGLEI